MKKNKDYGEVVSPTGLWRMTSAINNNTLVKLKLDFLNLVGSEKDLAG